MSEPAEPNPSVQAPADAAAPASPEAPPLALGGWLREGLRAAVFLKPRVGPQQPAPAQFVLLLLLVLAVQVALSRFEIRGAATFDLRGWLAPKWSNALLLLLAWLLLPSQRRDPAAPSGLT
ncbi:MAG: hypothetical protein JWQ33_3095, partial [Ramlibacter sp.]|nr:hypothetical protein [Ramlibacter sp.]